MRLVYRSAIGQRLKSDIEKYIQDRILRVEGRPSPQVLRDLSANTKEWIAKKAAYAIFSHRWLDAGELTYQDVSKFDKLSISGFQKLINDKPNRNLSGGADILNQVIGLASENTEMDGRRLLEIMTELSRSMSDAEKYKCRDFVKLIEFFNASAQYGCDYVWFDTGCIDKSRSAELEESIRSMFNWYRASKICIVHLADTVDLLSLRRDPWFTRGWTLQELLAPKSLVFFGKSWRRITPRLRDNDNDKAADQILKVPLWQNISNITGIPVDRLLDFTPGINHARETLVWVSKRRTTRIEDMAYCLLGLLEVPLSIAYGEGGMAFRRLQVEILHHSHDVGLFAWRGQPSAYNSMLAEDPYCFSSLPFQLLCDETPTDTSVDQIHTLTNYGLRIPLSVYTVNILPQMLEADENVGTLGPLETSLKVDVLGTITVKSPLDLKRYDSLEVAVLGVFEHQSALGILLGFENRRCKRIPTEDYITFSVPAAWQPKTPQTRLIE